MDQYFVENLSKYRSCRSHITLKTINFWFLQIAECIEFFKREEIAHLDLKAQNLAIAKTLNIKVIDFSESIRKENGVKV